MLVVALAAVGAVAQNLATDKRLMTDEQYESLLSEVEAKLPVWESALKRVNPAAQTNMPNWAGAKIANFRDLGLQQVGWARQWVERLRVKRTVSGELGLEGFLQGIYDQMDGIVVMELATRVNFTKLESYQSEVSDVTMRLANDVTARVALLEKNTCP